MKTIPTLAMLIIAIILPAKSFCQDSSRCSTTDYMNILISDDSSWLSSINSLERALSALSKPTIDDDIDTIPVVVHVVWHDNQKVITDGMIHKQLQILNDDFGQKAGMSGYNPNDTRIRFVLSIHSDINNCA